MTFLKRFGSFPSIILDDTSTLWAVSGGTLS